MKTRLLTAAIALPILIAAIVLPVYIAETRWIFVAIAAAALAAGLFEYFSLTKKLELKGDAAIAYLVSAAIFVAFVFDAPSVAPDLFLATLAGSVIVLIATQTFRFRPDFSKMLTGTGVTLLGIFYITFLGGFIVAMRTGFESYPGLSTHLLGYFFLVIMG
ncbi:MAG: hypothetical protein C4325_04300, partial [Blastocatellia bacterium]